MTWIHSVAVFSLKHSVLLRWVYSQISKAASSYNNLKKTPQAEIYCSRKKIDLKRTRFFYYWLSLRYILTSSQCFARGIGTNIHILLHFFFFFNLMNYFRLQLVMVPFFFFFFELGQKDGQAQPGLSKEWCFGSRTVKTKEKKWWQ